MAIEIFRRQQNRIASVSPAVMYEVRAAHGDALIATARLGARAYATDVAIERIKTTTQHEQQAAMEAPFAADRLRMLVDDFAQQARFELSLMGVR